MAALIQFRCRAIEHQNVAVQNVSASPITLHEGRWAYCPLGVPEGHEWTTLEVGRPFDDVRRMTFSEAPLPIEAGSRADARRQ